MTIISYSTGRPSLWSVLVERFADFGRYKWRCLGRDKKWRRFRIAAYFSGAVLATHALLEIAFDFNLRLFDPRVLPSWDFYRRQLVPFLAQPLIWTGLDLRSLHSYIALSGVGAAIWAHAEYRSNTYLFLYPFPKLQRRPGDFDLHTDWSQPPTFPSPPKTLSKRNFVRLAETLFLTYTFLGIIAAIVGFAAGVRTLGCWAWEIGAFVIVTIGLAVEHVCTVFDERVDQDYWNPKRLHKIMNFHWRYYYRLKEGSMNRGIVIVGRYFEAFIWKLLDDGGRVFSLVIIALVLVVVLLS